VQLVALEANRSAGQAPDEPVQVSATSHGPAELRQVKDDDWKTSTQVASIPEQWSAPSHNPPWEVPVQLVAFDLKPLSVQLPDPLHVSWFSHGPAMPLHAVPAVLGVVDEQTPVATLQVAANVHWSPAAQLTGLDPTHTLLWHVSVCVHALPSLHDVPFAAPWQPSVKQTVTSLTVGVTNPFRLIEILYSRYRKPLN
jgi:hypothetical protein